MTRQIRWLREYAFHKSVPTEPLEWSEITTLSGPPKPAPLAEFADFEHVFKQGDQSHVWASVNRLMITGIGTIEKAVEGVDYEFIA